MDHIAEINALVGVDIASRPEGLETPEGLESVVPEQAERATNVRDPYSKGKYLNAKRSQKKKRKHYRQGR